MKEKLTSADSVSWPVPRQSWMTELPPGLKSIGFDTPADRERKAKVRRRPPLSMDNEETVLSGRDKRLAEQVTPYNVSAIHYYMKFFSISAEACNFHKQISKNLIPHQIPSYFPGYQPCIWSIACLTAALTCSSLGFMA
uniref:Uncharacterized protein n=1 Tax=Anas platyrhynchos TaxID=8839 RepID=A0A8B9QP36_ANAPL